MLVTAKRGHVVPISQVAAPRLERFLGFGVPLFLLLMFVTSTVFVRQTWPVESCKIGIFVLASACLVLGIRGEPEKLASGATPWLVYLIPAWGIVQLLAGTTSSTLQTRQETLKWAGLAGVFYLTQTICTSHRLRRLALNAFLVFATAMSVLCLLQVFTSEGRVLWTFPTGYPDVYATFPSPNNYAQFAELALPIALWRALREGAGSWLYALSSALIFASVIASASRAGVVLCTAELILVLVLGQLKLRDPRTGASAPSVKTIVILVPVLAIAFTVAVGWQQVVKRFVEVNPYLIRREFILSAVDMARNRPLTGYGLGTFPEVYQQHAIKDFPFYANHAHCDWAEFAADGGVPFLLLVLIPFVSVIPAAFRYPWGLGLVAVMLHACVDYPFPRPAVSGWMFVILALLFVARSAEERPELN